METSSSHADFAGHAGLRCHIGSTHYMQNIKAMQIILSCMFVRQYIVLQMSCKGIHGSHTSKSQASYVGFIGNTDFGFGKPIVID